LRGLADDQEQNEIERGQFRQGSAAAESDEEKNACIDDEGSDYRFDGAPAL